MKRVFEKLASSLFLLLIASSFIVTSTFAWFSLNEQATMTGMIVNVETYDNLLIAPDTGTTAKAAESEFKNSLVTPLIGYLEPASTVDAIKFYYTSSYNVDGRGDAVSDTYIPYERYNSEDQYGRKPLNDSIYANLFSENYGARKDEMLLATGETQDSALGYIDYVFQLKAINAGSATANLVLTQLDLTCVGLSEKCDAYRVAIFLQDITTGDAGGAVKENLTGIYKEAHAKNFINYPENMAVVSANDLDTVGYVSVAEALATVAPKSTAYYKVIVRLWLEGEDDTCMVDTYLALDYKWGLDISFELKDGLSGCVTSLRDVSIITAAVYSVVTDGQIAAADNSTGLPLNVVTDLKLNGKQIYTTASAGVLLINAELFTVDGTTATNVNEFFRLQ